jgi:hypothetical protein
VLWISDDVAQADWIAAGLTCPPGPVTGSVPGGYPAYVRLCHPSESGERTFTWSEVADAIGAALSWAATPMTAPAAVRCWIRSATRPTRARLLLLSPKEERRLSAMPGDCGLMRRDNVRVRWRHLRGRVAVMATAAALVSMGAGVVVAFVGGGDSGGVGAFNACITQTRFLTLVRHGDGNSFIETIKDRVRGGVVGQVTAGRTPGRITPGRTLSILGGAAARDGRYVMSTATPLGRDATAIAGCWDRFFPIAPDA